MKNVDFSSFFDEFTAKFGLFTTFNFDPVFFENRILPSRALLHARHILILMDSGQYQKLRCSINPIRYINQRYLVVPIDNRKGVFHPKVSLLIGDNEALLLCGSNNLTLAGCTHNIELLNSLKVFNKDGETDSVDIQVVSDALAFFRMCCEKFSEERMRKIALKWFDEIPLFFPWINGRTFNNAQKAKISLVHSGDNNLLNWVNNRFSRKKIDAIYVISPFFDANLDILKTMHKTWPLCSFEIITQQLTSNLNSSKLRFFSRLTKLFDLQSSENRRLHGKLIAFISGDEAGCLVGSANFTNAAFEKNIEACFFVQVKKKTLENLFDDEFKKISIGLDEFRASSESEPARIEDESASLKLLSAYWDSKSDLFLRYQVTSEILPDTLDLVLLSYGDDKPIRTYKLPISREGREEVIRIEESILPDLQRGAVRCYLKSTIKDIEESSSVYWLVQELKLTYEPPNIPDRPKITELVQNGMGGLTELLDFVCNVEGVEALINFLRNFNIKFLEKNGLSGRRKAHIPKPIPMNPYRPAEFPAWMNSFGNERNQLNQALKDFVDRHEKKVLLRHAKSGNINGIDNFLYVFLELNKLVYEWHKKGILDRFYLIHKFCSHIDIFTRSVDYGDGYIPTLIKSLQGELGLLRKALLKANIPAHLRVALLITQSIRWQPGEANFSHPLQHFGLWKEKIEDALKELKLGKITLLQMEEALKEYIPRDGDDWSKFKPLLEAIAAENI